MVGECATPSSFTRVSGREPHRSVEDHGGLGEPLGHVTGRLSEKRPRLRHAWRGSLVRWRPVWVGVLRVHSRSVSPRARITSDDAQPSSYSSPYGARLPLRRGG